MRAFSGGRTGLAFLKKPIVALSITLSGITLTFLVVSPYWRQWTCARHLQRHGFVVGSAQVPSEGLGLVFSTKSPMHSRRVTR